MSRNLREAVMKRSQLKTKYYKINTPENSKLYKKQKTYVGSCTGRKEENAIIR